MTELWGVLNQDEVIPGPESVIPLLYLILTYFPLTVLKIQESCKKTLYTDSVYTVRASVCLKQSQIVFPLSTQLFVSLFVCSNKCNSMNAFQGLWMWTFRTAINTFAFRCDWTTCHTNYLFLSTPPPLRAIHTSGVWRSSKLLHLLFSISQRWRDHIITSGLPWYFSLVCNYCIPQSVLILPLGVAIFRKFHFQPIGGFIVTVLKHLRLDSFLCDLLCVEQKGQCSKNEKPGLTLIKFSSK